MRKQPPCLQRIDAPRRCALAGPGTQTLYAENPALLQDPRFKRYPQWMQAQVAAGGQGSREVGGQGKMTMDALRVRVVQTDNVDRPDRTLNGRTRTNG